VTPERWKLVQSIFQAVVESPPEGRSSLLERLCGGDAALRREVQELLVADGQAGAFLEAPTAPEAAFSMGEDAPAARAGPYRILGRIGEGGMSTVYAAVREDAAYEKRAAVKFFRAELRHPGLLQRFRVERQILAGLDHPHIAKLLDGGSTAEGVPFLVMDYVEGLPIDEYCDRHRLAVGARLELFRKVCAAVQYAHANLVVHRDIKPSNILVRSDGEPKLLDFGIAKLLNPGLSALQLEPTRADAYAMTPEYASPEQVRGEPVSTATDVYSLGVLFYKLLTGGLPYPVEKRTLPEIMQAIREDEPAKPSARVLSLEATMAETRSASPRSLSRQLRGDLDTILLKALRKEPERRYGSVEQLSEDLRRQREGLPVSARADTFAYRAGKFVRRHRMGVALASLAAALVVASTVTTAVQSVRLRRALSRAEAVTQFLRDTLGSANPYGGVGREATVVQVLERAVPKIDASFGDQPEVDATVRAVIGTTYRDLGRYEEARPLLESALATRRRVLRDLHPAVAESLLDLGVLLRGTGDFAGAETLYRQALALSERTQGRESLEAARALYWLGDLLVGRRAYAEAEPVAREALAIRRRLLPSPHVDVARSLVLLGAVLSGQGQYAEAEPLGREAIALLAETPYGRSPAMGIALNERAALLADMGDLAAAEPLFRQVLALRQEQLGEEHTAVGASMSNLAQLLVERESFEEAERLMREALRIFEKVLGEDNLRVADQLNNLAATLAGRPQEAEALLRRALAIHRRHWGGEHTDVAWDLGNLALVLRAQGRLGEAETCFRQSLALLRKLHGPTHPSALMTQANLGELLREKGDFVPALEVLQEAAELYAKTLPGDHREAAVCRSGLGAVLTELGRFQEADRELVAAYAVLKTAEGRDHEHTRETANRLERLAKLWRNPAFSARVRELLGK
jgi:serine/threonine-protein kinase